MEGAALSAPKYLGHDGTCPVATALCRRDKERLDRARRLQIRHDREGQDRQSLGNI